VIGGKDANVELNEFKLANNNGLKRSFTTNGSSSRNGSVARPSEAATNGSAATSGTNELQGLDLTASDSQGTKPSKALNLASVAHLSPDWQVGYNRLLLRSEGVLFEDTQIQVGLRSEYRGQMGCVILYFTNRSPSTIGSFTTTLDNRSADHLRIDTKNLPEPTIAPDAQTQQMIMFEARSVFTDPPTIRISYLAGALQALTLQLPVVLHKFMDAAELGPDDFFKRWKQIGGAPREAQKVFGLAGRGKKTTNMTFTRKAVEGFKWGVLDGVDPNQKNVVGASVLHMSEAGKVGCLLRLEPNFDTKVTSPLHLDSPQRGTLH
jgi:AP-2 complex subunit alpha